MALTTVNITGTFNFPDATWTANTQAEFIISGYDTDTEVVVPSVVKSTLGVGGELDVDLWGNDDGLRGTVYRVNIVVYSDIGLTREVKRIDLGKIQINGDGPLDIATLLNGVITVPEVWYSVITEDEYNAAIAAAADAEAAQSAAEDAQSYAEEWAVNPEDDPVSVAAGGDGSTTFSAFHWAQKSEEFASAIDPSNYVTLDDFTAADRYIYSTGAATIAEGVITSQGRALLDDVNAAAQRVTLGVEIGVDVQAYDAALASIAGLSTSAGDVLYLTGSDTYARLAKGTGLQEFRMNAGATAPEWFTPTGRIAAWVNFNGTGTVAINASGNVSSITDDGTGRYTINFASALADANYAFSGVGRRSNDTGLEPQIISELPSASAVRTTSALAIISVDLGVYTRDSDNINVIVVR